MSDLLFGRDVRPSAEMAVGLINTSAARNGSEALEDTAVLVEIGRRADVNYRPDGSRSEILAMRKLRDALASIVEAEADEARFVLINELFYSASAIPQIVTHDEDPRPHFHYTLEDARYVDHITGITAYAFARLIIMGEWSRIRTCARDECNTLFLDTSRNGKRLYCNSQTCGNRIHAARYRDRRSAANAVRDAESDTR
jgi:predicted RNA-binding Zn ribbon-like protein